MVKEMQVVGGPNSTKEKSTRGQIHHKETAVEEFAYVQYNHVRPHSYNNYKTPYEARYGVA